jgi:hypothetical protein
MRIQEVAMFTVGVCLVLHLSLAPATIADQNSDEVWYEVRCQFWEWETADGKVNFRKPPENARLSETIMFVRSGGQNYCEAKIGVHALAYAVVDTLDEEKKPFLRVIYRVSSSKKRRMTGSGQCWPAEIGKRVYLGGGGRQPKGGIHYAQAVTCIITRIKRKDIEQKIQAIDK